MLDSPLAERGFSTPLMLWRRACETHDVHRIDPTLKLLVVLATLAGVGITAWVARSGHTTVGKGMLKKTITSRSHPWAFAFEVIKLGLATLVLAGFSAYLLTRD